jgi:hypothetical protein
MTGLIDHWADLFRRKLDGRQIRNAFICARHFASYNKEPLSWKHIDHATQNATLLEEYIDHVHDNLDISERAKRNEARADNFTV